MGFRKSLDTTYLSAQKIIIIINNLWAVVYFRPLQTQQSSHRLKVK